MSGDDDEVYSVKLRDLNSVLTCRLCNGYLIDATTITECLHTFCRSCILNYLDESRGGGGGGTNIGGGLGLDKMSTGARCPTCDCLIHESHPKQHIMSDSTIDEIVMKLVPGLRERELEREKDFYTRKNLKWPKADMIAAQKETAAKKRKLQSVVTSLSATDEHSNSSLIGGSTGNVNGQSLKEEEEASSTVDELEEDDDEENDPTKYHRDDIQIRFILEPSENETTLPPMEQKYVSCSEHTPVSAIKKVVCKQLGLKNPNQIDLTCAGSKLGKDHSMKFVFITRWRGKKDHLLINYQSTSSNVN